MGSSSAFAMGTDGLLFGAFPYVALIIFFLVTIQRYRQKSFSYSSLSSQFLENRQHFWGMVPFHYGILVVRAGHVVGFLIPRTVLWWNSVPARLYILEVSALICGLLTLVGFLQVIVRRLGSQRLRTVTTPSDWVLQILLLFQIVSGITIAVFHGWGSSWYASTVAPYLWSIVKLAPDVSYVAPLPLFAKLHILSAYTLIAFFPFTRLVHVLVIPNMYLWRRTQVVRWNWNRRSIRRPAARK